MGIRDRDTDGLPAHDHDTADETNTSAAQSVQLSISGATCASCVRTIESALRNTPGVDNADMNFADRTAQVTGTASTWSRQGR